MLNMFKSGFTKQGLKLVANVVRTSQLNKVKTCFIIFIVMLARWLEIEIPS